MGPKQWNKAGLQRMVTLVKRHPDSALVPHTLLSIGEFYFNENKLFPAMKAYEKVIARGEATTAPYASYKLAWCHYNIADFHRALATFARLSRSGHPQLAKEAARDALHAYAEVGPPDGALIWFKALHNSAGTGKAQTLRLIEHFDDLGLMAKAQIARQALQDPVPSPGAAARQRAQTASGRVQQGKLDEALVLIDGALVLSMVMRDGAGKTRLLDGLQTDLVAIFDKALLDPSCGGTSGQGQCAQRALALHKIFWPEHGDNAAMAHKLGAATPKPTP
jgi:tetratricopeptide (TPR) repeat protein